MEYDVFICHASEDKQDFVRPLAKALQEQRLSVWYDEFTLVPGSSLRRSIDLGLAKCRFGIVVLSENFFKKSWTQWELDGLVARQIALENEVIIPVWYKISISTLLAKSPPLADKVAVNADLGIESVVREIMRRVNPNGSTLVVARDFIAKAGIEHPPVVTDDWWLDVLEYSGQEWLHHNYLSFAMPWHNYEPKERGEYIGRHALQKMWQEEADEIGLSQLTHPGEVLRFIESQPGLKDVCLDQPAKIAFCFPQLTIRGFGGFLEPLFDNPLKAGTRYKSKHTCEEEVALRAPDFGNYDLGELASIYFTGNGGGIGPSTTRHPHIDFVLWLLSSKSAWLPSDIRSALLQGLKEWAVWDWQKGQEHRTGFKENEYTGALVEAMYLSDSDNLAITPEIEEDIETRVAHSKDALELPETTRELYELFLKTGAIDQWVRENNRRLKK